MTKRDRERAQRHVGELALTADAETIKRVLCAVLGHPPVVHYCFGQLSCARCGAVVGDTLMGADTTKGRAVVGRHGKQESCEECMTVWRALKPEQRLLTENPDKELTL